MNIINTFFLFTISLPIFARNSYNPSKELPLEMQMMFKTIDSEFFPSNLSEEINLIVPVLDHSLKFIDSKNRLFLIKSEFYKRIIEEKYNSEIPLPNQIEIKETEIIKKLNAKKEAYSNFSTWIITFSLNDLKKNDHRNDLIKPWLYYFLNWSPEQFNNYTNKILVEILNNLKDLSSLYLQKNSETSNTLMFFSPKESMNNSPEIIALPENIDSDPLQVLKNINTSNNLPIIPTPTWTPNDNVDVIKNSTIRIINPDPKYTPPAQLPTPINDWAFDAEGIIFKQPQPQYTPPSSLPVPTNDW